MPDALLAMRSRHQAQGRPASGWVFPSRSKSGHLERWGYKDQHRRALDRIAKAHEMDASAPMIGRFEPYCLRHTALTWISPNADVFTLARIAGHSSITTTMKYVHPQAEAVEMALKRTAGVPTGATPKAEPEPEEKAEGNAAPKRSPTE